ncbi:MipA/OmpV family protein [Paraburkholderia sp. JHI869]|uniref:MipA/OmpV family protein n=1 Tax=Paraburkholderia sp. JHI869 TaxID=3112959 RepID=UPI00317408A6
MKKNFAQTGAGAIALAAALLYTGSANADGLSSNSPVSDDSGLTILSNATNVTRWGLGAGVVLRAQPYSGDGTKVTPVPLVTFDDKWVSLYGTTLDLKIGHWDGVSVALRGQYAVTEGYKASDAPILNGMQDRKAAFWYGPSVKWQTAFGTLSGAFLLGGNKGERAKIGYGKAFRFGDFTLEPNLGVEWLSAKYVGYYYGVMPSEATIGRAAYSGNATWNASIGAHTSYQLTRRQSVTLDAAVTRLGSGISDSPITGKRYSPAVLVGYHYQFN